MQGLGDQMGRRGSLAWPGLAGFALWRCSQQAWVTDDAFLYFRYAENWAQHGLGPVYNAGEWVLGVSSPLWLLLLTGAAALGLDLPTAAMVLGGICSMVGVLLLLGAPPRCLYPLAALLLVFPRGMADYMTSGLESGAVLLVCAGMVRGFAMASRKEGDRSLALWAVLAAWVRLDLVLVGGALCLGNALIQGKGGLRRLPWIVAPMCLGVLAECLVLVLFYGAPLPNTFYAKSGLGAHWGQGIFYLADFLLPYGIPLLLVGLTWWGRKRWASQERPVRLRAFVLASAGLLHGIWVLRVGGDFMHARLWLPAWLLLLVAMDEGLGAARWLSETLERSAWRDRATLFGLAILTLWLARLPPLQSLSGHPEAPLKGITDERRHYVGPEDPRVPGSAHSPVDGRDLRRIASFLPEGDSLVVAAWVVGLIGYHGGPRVSVVDAYGLVDPVVARLQLTTRGRPGHEKSAPPEYLRHRQVDCGAGWAPELPIVSALSVPGCGALLRVRPGLLEAVSKAQEDPDFPVQFTQDLQEALEGAPFPWDCGAMRMIRPVVAGLPALAGSLEELDEALVSECQDEQGWIGAHSEDLARLESILDGPSGEEWPWLQLSHAAWLHRVRF